MIEEHHITVEKTARYYTTGELGRNTREIWFVLHGYAQLAKDFITNFDIINEKKRYIIAPEALNRFYTKGIMHAETGYAGKPASTWMTSEDRGNEILDYVHYLDQLYTKLVPEKFKGKVCVLGFSQGVATASRWIHHSVFQFHQFIAYSGEIAFELREPVSQRLRIPELVYITGKNDPLIHPENHKKAYELMNQLKARIIEFEGGHEMNEEVIAGFR